ncbi:MAG: chorismate mutase [Actinomycetota bacterium]|nr:chorismate mutase [Actinomycetota bacterium]
MQNGGVARSWPGASPRPFLPRPEPEPPAPSHTLSDMEREPRLLALRGAITLDADTKDEVSEKTQRLVKEMLARNDVNHDDLVSIIFTATDDVTADFPAAAARALGLGDVPLLCARELGIANAMPLCVRVLMHLYSDRRRDELHHVYLEGARGLRDDLPE